MTYVPVLKEQHEKILALVQELELSWQQRQVPQFQNFCSDLIDQLKIHHELELEILFSNAPETALKQGGPFCSYYFEFFMHNRPIKVAEYHVHKLSGNNAKIDIPITLSSYFDKNSSLSIPLEEHLALEALVFTLQKDVHTAEESAVTIALHYFSDLVKLNIKKEETCLWALLQEVVLDTKQKTYCKVKSS